MARVFTQAEAKQLGLPGRKALEIVSGARGARGVTLRLAEIPVPHPGETLRGPHLHYDFEECIYILNWHELNIPPLGVAAETLHREHGMAVLTVQACFVAEELFGKECNGLTHGGEIEALAVLAYRPELVHLDRIDNSSDLACSQQMDALRRTRTYQPVFTDVRSIAPTGWYGSPQYATAEKAQVMLNTVADSIARKSTEIFAQLDELRGSIAEIKTLSKVR